MTTLADTLTAINANRPGQPRLTIAGDGPRADRQVLIALTDSDGNGPRSFRIKGFGRVTVNALTQAAEEAGISARNYPPGKRDHTYATNVIQSRASDMIAYMSNHKSPLRPDGARHYWELVAKVSKAVIARFWLMDNDPTLYHSGDAGHTEIVVARYRADRGTEIREAGQASAWVKSTLVREFKATDTLYGYVVPMANVAAAQRFMAAVKANWPTCDTLVDGLGVVTDASLGHMLAAGIVREIDKEINAYTSARDKARANAKRGDLGPKAATTYLNNFAELSDRAMQFAAILPVEEMSDALRRLAAVKAELESLAPDCVLRFAMLDLTPATPEAESTPVSPAERKAEAAHNARVAGRMLDMDRPAVQATPANLGPVCAPETFADLADTRTPDQCRAEYAQYRADAGMPADLFRRMCERKMSADGIDAPTPRDWANAARRVRHERFTA